MKILLAALFCLALLLPLRAEEPSVTAPPAESVPPASEEKAAESASAERTAEQEAKPSETPASDSTASPDRHTPPARDQIKKEADGSDTIILRENPDDKKMPYDPYRRFSGDSAKSPEVRQKEIEQKFPEEIAKEKAAKAARDARPQSVKDREKQLLDKTPVLEEKKNPTLKNRDSIPKRF